VWVGRVWVGVFGCMVSFVGSWFLLVGEREKVGFDVYRDYGVFRCGESDG
jgi:hypothetical protein